MQEILDRLMQRPNVDGLLEIGSMARNALTPASDFDLVIVLADAVQAWYAGVTQIDGRLTDLLFVASEAVGRIEALKQPVPHDHELAPIIRWLADGRIAFDRTGRLQRLQQQVRQADWVQSIDQRASYSAWFAANFNLAHAERMLSTADPLYRTTAQIRMAVYGHSDLWFGYFTMRKLAWRGDKAGVAYLQEQDPAFLATYQAFVGEIDPARKLSHYRQAAALATAPLGGLCPPGSTAMNVAGTAKVWEELMGRGK